MRQRRFGGDTGIRSPPRRNLQGGRDYSPPRRQSGYVRSPIQANMQARDYSRYLLARSPTQASMQGRETLDYSQPRNGLRERHSHFVPGSSSMSSEMEKSRRVLSGEHPSGSMDRSDYNRHLGEDRDRQLRELSQFNKGLPQKDSPSMKFQWKHLLDEPKSMNGKANQSSKHFPGYGASISTTRVSTEKNYQGSRFADMSRSGMRVEKSMAMETERGRTFPAYPPESGNMRSSMDIDGDGLFLPSQNLNVSFHKDEELRFQDHLPVDKLSATIQSARELYKEAEIPKFYSREEKSRFYSKDTSHYVMSSSQSKASSNVPFRSSMENFHHSRGDGCPVRSNGLKRSSGMLTEPIGYTHISHLNSSRDLNMRLEDTINYRQVQLSPNEGTHKGYIYPEVKRSEKSEMAAESVKLYGKMASGDYGHRDSIGPRIVEPIIDRIVVTEDSRGEHLSEGRIWDNHHSSHEQQISNYLEAAGSPYASEKYGEGLSPRSLHLKDERDVYRSHGDMYLTEDHGYGRDTGLQSDEERLNMWMTEYDPGLDGVDDNHQEGYSREELQLLEQPKKMLKRKCDVETKLSRQNHGSKFSTNSKIHDSKSNKSLLNASRYRNIGRTFNEMVGHRNSNYVVSDKPSVCKRRRFKSSVSDVKKRLGPFRSVPPHSHIPHPSVKKYKMHKFLRINQDGYNGSIHAEVGGHSNGNLPSVKFVPPENSEDFKQLVNSAFFKFLKQLNENPAQCRRIKEQGKAGSLRCSVCGRSVS